MAFPRWLALLNKAGLNRVVRHIAPAAPGLGLVVHTGRRSGRTYQTPVEVFRTDGGFIVALTYGGEKTDWVRNVLAAGGCQLRTGGRVCQAVSPRVYRDESRSGIRRFERQVLRAIGTCDFMFLAVAGDTDE